MHPNFERSAGTCSEPPTFRSKPPVIRKHPSRYRPVDSRVSKRSPADFRRIRSHQEKPIAADIGKHPFKVELADQQPTLQHGIGEQADDLKGQSADPASYSNARFSPMPFIICRLHIAVFWSRITGIGSSSVPVPVAASASQGDSAWSDPPAPAHSNPASPCDPHRDHGERLRHAQHRRTSRLVQVVATRVLSDPQTHRGNDRILEALPASGPNKSD